MRDEEATKILIDTIGKNHISKIAQYAENNDFQHNYGSERSLKQIISYVLHRKRDVPEIENLILECAEFHQKEKEKQSKRIKRLAGKARRVKK